MLERAQLNPDWICVRNLNEAEYTEEAEMVGQDHEGALLDETELKDAPGAQELVGQKRIMSFMQQLETREYEIAGSDKTDGNQVVTTGKTTNDAPSGTVAPVGSTQNKIYRKPKGN